MSRAQPRRVAANDASEPSAPTRTAPHLAALGEHAQAATVAANLNTFSSSRSSTRGRGHDGPAARRIVAAHYRAEVRSEYSTAGTRILAKARCTRACGTDSSTPSLAQALSVCGINPPAQTLWRGWGLLEDQRAPGDVGAIPPGSAGAPSPRGGPTMRTSGESADKGSGLTVLSLRPRATFSRTTDRSPPVGLRDGDAAHAEGGELATSSSGMMPPRRPPPRADRGLHEIGGSPGTASCAHREDPTSDRIDVLLERGSTIISESGASGVDDLESPHRQRPGRIFARDRGRRARVGTRIASVRSLTAHVHHINRIAVDAEV